MICFGATDAFFSLTLGRLTKYTGRIPVFISGAVIHIAAIIVMLIWKPDYHLVWVFYVIAALLGYCDAVWQTQINGKTWSVNCRLADSPLLRTLAILDKIQIPGYRGLTGNDFRYYGFSLIRTLNEDPSVSAITRVDCNQCT